MIQQHVAIGLKTLKKNCELSELVTRLISEHHEYLDGSGFPAGIKAEKIHPLSKLFQVAVRYDELVHGMLDCPAVTPHGALAQLYREAKVGLLDEHSVSTLVSLLSVYPVGSAVLLSAKEKGVVIETNNEFPKEPRIKIFYDVSGTAHATLTEVDLAQQKNDSKLTIVSVLYMKKPDTDPAKLLEL